MTSQQERAGDAFIQALDQLLASGESDITATRYPIDPKPGVTVVGYENEHFCLSAAGDCLPRGAAYPPAEVLERSHWQSVEGRWLAATGAARTT
jgi:hypothetical protein